MKKNSFFLFAITSLFIIFFTSCKDSPLDLPTPDPIETVFKGSQYKILGKAQLETKDEGQTLILTNLDNINEDGIRFNPSESPSFFQARPIFGESGGFEYSRINTETNKVLSGFRIFKDSSNEEVPYSLAILGDGSNEFEFLSDGGVVYIGDGGGIRIWCGLNISISDDGTTITLSCTISSIVTPNGTFDIDEIRLNSTSVDPESKIATQFKGQDLNELKLQ